MSRLEEIAVGKWMTPSIKAEESQAGKWTVVPIPRLPVDGAVNASNQGGSSFYVLNIPGKEKAAEFLTSTFGSNVDLYQDLVTDIGAIGTYIPALDEEAFNQPDDFFGGQKIVSDFHVDGRNPECELWNAYVRDYGYIDW
ncbi:hypothetical protein [Oceanobacillus alkalisoli]|uniref:hypothetical protein n=1 Tax=Oceanobacillus alkalisoli TaxID=2925113 RepID=UPI0028730E06|nr:hypothetical protein [Oceanobacillus alkalisoli]